MAEAEGRYTKAFRLLKTLASALNDNCNYIDTPVLRALEDVEEAYPDIYD